MEGGNTSLEDCTEYTQMSDNIFIIKAMIDGSVPFSSIYT